MSDFDVIVVGSGATGAAVAWRLCTKGFKVACVERGPRVDPDTLPASYSNWEWHKVKKANPAAGTRTHAGDYPVDDSASPIAVCNYNGVGGSTLIYSAHFPRFRPPDFRTKTDHGVGEDWPITYDTLRPYFDLNEQENGVSGLSGDPAYPEIENTHPPVPLGQAGSRLAQAFNDHGWHWWPSFGATLPNPDPAGPDWTKSSADLTYLPKAEAAGLTLLPDTAVSHVLTQGDRAMGLACFDKDRRGFELRARHIVLAGSALGTPRILLNSASAAHPKGLCNSSDQVGRNLMLHPLGYVEGVFDETFDIDTRPQGCLFHSHQFYRAHDADHDLGYMMQALRMPGPAESALGAHSRRKLKFGTRVYDDFEALFRKQMVIAIVCEDLPEPDNRVELMLDRPDRFGTPGLRVNYALSDNSRKLLNHGMTRAREVLATAGARRSFVFGPVRNTGWHIMGTARMGKD
ncbi:MAG: GMC family oxidoreductase, partial [Pseudomonadota bacterium]